MRMPPRYLYECKQVVYCVFCLRSSLQSCCCLFFVYMLFYIGPCCCLFISLSPYFLYWRCCYILFIFVLGGIAYYFMNTIYVIVLLNRISLSIHPLKSKKKRRKSSSLGPDEQLNAILYFLTNIIVVLYPMCVKSQRCTFPWGTLVPTFTHNDNEVWLQFVFITLF